MNKKEGFKNTASAIIKGVYFIMPFAVAGGVLVTLAYIIDLIFGGEAVYGLGSENSIAIILKSLGTLTFSLMLPVLSAIIAVEISSKGAFAAGIVGGYLAQNGATLKLPYGDSRSVSGFIGAIAAGVIAGLIFKALQKHFKKSEKSWYDSSKILFLPLLSVLGIGIFMLTVNPLIGFVNTGISAALFVLSETNPIVFGGILGALTAIDMGGAFTKSAFIFATAAIASGEYTAMAAVMSAGMTVPLSIALCSFIFRIKFSKKETQLAKANLIFGLCSITEGAIPIAAKNPTRVIPACTIAAAVSGALSAGFGCTLIAPYGGLLVIPLTGRPLFFIVSVFTGTIVGAVLLGILKKEPKTRFTEPVKIEVEEK